MSKTNVMSRAVKGAKSFDAAVFSMRGGPNTIAGFAGVRMYAKKGPRCLSEQEKKSSENLTETSCGTSHDFTRFDWVHESTE